MTQTPMKTPAQAYTFTIPACIVALPGLTLPERVVLARLAEQPTTSNGKLVRLTWLTHRGVEALIRRLRQQGHLQLVTVDGTRHLLVPAASASHTECGKPNATTTHTACGPSAAPPDNSPPDPTVETERQLPSFGALELRLTLARTCLERRDYRNARLHCEAGVQLVTVEEGLDPAVRANGVAALQRSADILFAHEHLMPRLVSYPRPAIETAVCWIENAPSAKLAGFRSQFLAGVSPAQATMRHFRVPLPDYAGMPASESLAPSTSHSLASHSALSDKNHSHKNKEEND